MAAMLQTQHLCEKVFLLSLSGLILLLTADYKYLFLPINGIWLLLYVMLISATTIWGTFVGLQKLLQMKVPLDYDTVKANNPLIGYTYDAWFDDGTSDGEAEQTIASPLKSIDQRINDFSADIETKFVSRWYDNITKDGTFKSETQQLLELIVRRFLQVVVFIDSKKVTIGILSIVLKHLKEYRKTLRRIEKGGGNVQGIYRYAHIASKSETALEHFMHKLTAHLVREFISWELCNSLPCRCLVSILAKRFTTYLLIAASRPGHFNYKTLTTCCQRKCEQLAIHKYAFISLSDVDLSGRLEQVKKDFPIKTKTEKQLIDKADGSTPKLSPKKAYKSSAKTDDEVDCCTIGRATVKPFETARIDRKLFGTAATKPIDIVSDQATVEDTANNGGSELSYKPRRSEAVKIHEPRPTSKTWRDSADLDCISLGQDLLAIQDTDDNNSGNGGTTDMPISTFIERKLWGETDSGESEKLPHPMWDIHESWYGEDDNDINEDGLGGVRKKVSPSGSTHSIHKPPIVTSATNIITNTVGNVTASTLHNMKELQQSTVNNVVKPVSQATSNAMHKIGDLQDEAAGVMEGILDFGIAGIRKGLRLTGLQDIHTDLQGKPKAQEDANKAKSNVKLIKIGHVTSEDVKNIAVEKTATDPDDSVVWMNPLNKDSPGSFDGHILLETATTTGQTIPMSYSAELSKLKENIDEMMNPEEYKPVITNIPQISTDFDTTDDSLIVDSPEYEEAADLESTIIKLRSLLQQRSSESSLNTPAISPMPMDDKMCTTPVDLTECSKVDGTMPSLYKLCAKTATGVFNTVKNVLPGNAIEQGNVGNEKWLFVENEVRQTDLIILMESLLVERRDFCMVDTAYEAMDSVDLLTESASSQQSWNENLPSYEDETDELESTIPITKAIIDILCECLIDTDTTLIREPIVKLIIILGGNKSEEAIENYCRRFLKQISKYVGALPKNQTEEVLALELCELVEAIVEELPDYIKKIIGVHNLQEALQFLLTSFQSQSINQDVFVQIFELISAQIVVASSLMSPTPSA